MSSHNSAVQTLLATLDLETLEKNLYRGMSPQVGWQRVFGGQVIGQALVAAQRTVEAERKVHSLHCYFMRPGDPAVPIIYEVDRIRDGGSFTTRIVVAIQHGQAIFSLLASFQVERGGPGTPDCDAATFPCPRTCRPRSSSPSNIIDHAPENVRRYWQRDRPIELRPVDLKHYVSREKLEPRQNIWFRATGPLPADPAVQSAVLAYASDMTLLDTSLFAHGDVDLRSQASGRKPRPLDLVSPPGRTWRNGTSTRRTAPVPPGRAALPAARSSRATGTLVASVAQEGLIRVRRT